MIKKVAIQGYGASFHDIAARQFFGGTIQPVPCDTFADTFATLHDAKASYAVVALENSLFGSINQVYDLLLKYRFWIIGEVYLQIEQCLVGFPSAELEDIKEVHSHPVALAQCEEYLDTTLPHAERFEHHDTAASVADIKEWGDASRAAIASAAAAELHGMRIIARGIETNKQNYTRFVVLSTEAQPASDADKASLVLITSHTPGALYKALGAFANRGINLSKLQSRPIIGQAWQYMFYVDVETNDQGKLQAALKELESQQCEVIQLGSYRAGR